MWMSSEDLTTQIVWGEAWKKGGHCVSEIELSECLEFGQLWYTAVSPENLRRAGLGQFNRWPIHQLFAFSRAKSDNHISLVFMLCYWTSNIQSSNFPNRQAIHIYWACHSKLPHPQLARPQALLSPRLINDRCDWTNEWVSKQLFLWAGILWDECFQLGCIEVLIHVDLWVT